MRILSVGSMYPPHHLGGYELSWRATVERQRAAGHEVRVLTTAFQVPDPDPDIPEDPQARRELEWYWDDHGWRVLRARERLALERRNLAVLEAELEEIRPEVVNWWAMGGMSLSLIERVRTRGLPAVGVVGDEWMVYGSWVDSWQRATRRLGPLRRAAGALTRVPATLDLAGAASWLFNSEFTRRRSLEAIGALPRSAVVNPGIAPQRFPVAPQRSWQGRLLYVGRIDPRKGVELAVEALAELEDARLSLLGDGERAYLDALRGRIAELGVGERVEFARRPREQLGGAYAQADAILFPVLWEEPWGLVPLEAMSVGRPVIATGSGGSAEYLRDGENCLIFDPSEGPGGIAAAVRRLRDDAELRGRLRDGGFATAARFTESAYADAISAELERAVRDGR